MLWIYYIGLVNHTWTYEHINITIPIWPMVKVVGIDPGTFDSSSQYSIHWTSLTQDAGVTICLVPFHAAFVFNIKILDVMGIEPGTFYS